MRIQLSGKFAEAHRDIELGEVFVKQVRRCGRLEIGDFLQQDRIAPFGLQFVQHAQRLLKTRGCRQIGRGTLDQRTA
jgi:hypothetical protein